MRDAMKHGGPDDCGIYIDDTFPLAFGHRRLSFLDLSPLGHQPMKDDSGKIILIFNGEIYNFLEIRKELEQKQYRFRSGSDTEVIIASYLEWGKECFKRFNGMFALAILDKRSNKLLLVRDHAGIKPLYYSIQKDALYFASEVRAFTSINPNWPENKDWKKYFLMFGHLPEPITTLDNVQPLQKGTILEIDLPSLEATSHRFFQLYYNYTIDDKEEAIAKVHEKLTNAVERHLISDAPIGLFLSGGLDSSLLTLLAKPFIPDSLHALSIIFDNEKYSEKYYQELIIKKTNANHRSYLVTEQDFRECLPDIIEAMDQPSNDGINSYFICKYAKEYGLKAVLSGLGADELFGGYQSFNRTKAVGYIKWVPDFMFRAAGIFPDDKKKKLRFLGVKNGVGEYLFNRGFFIPSQVAHLLDCTEKEVDEVLIDMQSRTPVFIDKLVPQEKVSYLESNFYMQNQLLKDTDYMSMWHGVEVRVPFLDKELMELVYSINPDIRYSSERNKYLLIAAFIKQLPTEVWKRPKQGFVFPFEQWMRHVTPAGDTSNKLTVLHDKLSNGKIHWSRYWSYVLAKNGQSGSIVIS
jgi:asparagine synthase (glutamine-hydrolysing)